MHPRSATKRINTKSRGSKPRLRDTSLCEQLIILLLCHFYIYPSCSSSCVSNFDIHNVLFAPTCLVLSGSLHSLPSNVSPQRVQDLMRATVLKLASGVVASLPAPFVWLLAAGIAQQMWSYMRFAYCIYLPKQWSHPPYAITFS
jgi:hypothetical protein